MEAGEAAGMSADPDRPGALDRSGAGTRALACPSVADGSEKTKLALWRERRGVTQEELARATGLSTSVYWRLENGRYDNPPLRYLMNCALALGCELTDLIEDEWRQWMVVDQANAGTPPKPAEFWRKFD